MTWRNLVPNARKDALVRVCSEESSLLVAAVAVYRLHLERPLFLVEDEHYSTTLY